MYSTYSLHTCHVPSFCKGLSNCAGAATLVHVTTELFPLKKRKKYLNCYNFKSIQPTAFILAMCLPSAKADAIYIYTKCFCFSVHKMYLF